MNSWTNTASGFWHDKTNWSLGALPASSHSVFITNAFSKNVTINSDTSGFYPGSMNVGTLTLSGSGGSTNSLFLSNAGLDVSLHVLNGCTITAGGSLGITNSALWVQNACSIDGAVKLDSGTITFGQNTKIGNTGAGTLTVAGGTMIIANSYADLYIGYNSAASGAIWITGGQLIATNNAFAYIGWNGVGQAVVSNGSLQVDSLEVGSWWGQSGLLAIAGGTVTVNSLDGNSSGTVSFSNGTLHAKSISLSNPLTVGDGIQSATLDLVSGGYSYVNGLTISSNAFLTGCGTVYPIVTNNGEVLANCSGGALAFNGALVNNGSITATNGAAVYVSGSAVNNGIIDGTAGSIFFNSGVINNGTILPFPPPTAPSNLTAVSVAPLGLEIDLTWQNASTNETGFAVERMSDGPAFAQIALLPAGTTNYTDTGPDLAAPITYLYRVRATNSVGFSAYSNIATATTWTVTNSWVNPSDGAWQEGSNWSLGMGPDFTQSVLVTNDGNKSITVDSTTSIAFSNTMTVNDVTISGSSGATNRLLLSNVGADSPLHIRDSLIIGSNGVLLMTNSVLLVDGLAGGAFGLDGIATLCGTNTLQGDIFAGFSTNSTGSISLADGKTVLSNGYTVLGFYGSAKMMISNSTLQVVNSNSLPMGVYLGLTSGSQGELNIVDGSCFLPGHLSIGVEAASTGRVWLSRGQLVASNDYLTSIGNAGVGQLVVSNGQMRAHQGIVGSNPSSEGTLTISGGTATFNGGLVVGQARSATGAVFVTDGQLNVTNQTVFVGSLGVGQVTLSNSSFSARKVYVGYGHGSQGTLTFAGGDISVVSNLVAGAMSNATGMIQITGGNLSVTNQSGTGQLAIGRWGSGSLLQGGGSLTMDRLTIGCAVSNVIIGIPFFPKTNAVFGSSPGVGQVTLSNGVLRARTLEVGYGNGSQGTLTIAGGVTSVDSNLVAGVLSNATGVIQVTGGNLSVTNQSGTGQLVLGQWGRGTLVQGGGTVTVDQLVLTNGANSVFAFNAGVLTSGGTFVTNSQRFFVGDGTNAATFQLNGGVHSFANNLEIRNDATLTGCGTINGNTVVDLGGTALANCGTLTFTGIVTNNDTMRAIEGSVLGFYGTVVNNGVIDIINGSTLFHGGFINNGTVVSTDTVRITDTSIFGNDVLIQIPSYVGHTYQLQITPSLTPTNWANAYAPQPGTGNPLTFTDPSGATNVPSRFYRIQITTP